jgi:GNAT superfamily N-acetyltransferase
MGEKMKSQKRKVRIENLNESNIDDLILVCSSKRLNDPVHQKGMRLKKQWLLEMLQTYGPCAKIAYYNEKPAAQILYFPEEAEKTLPSRRENVLIINCIYNPTPEAQKLGIGKRLLQSVIEDAKRRRTCLGNKPCRFILAKAFNTGELLPLPEFYRKCGFTQVIENGRTLFYMPLEGGYESVPPIGEYETLEKDRGKAIVFYSPVCQFSYQFAKTIENTIKEVAPGIKVEMINEWENPQESMERKNTWLIVNAKPIQTFFMETEKFKEEIRQAAN